MFRRRTTDQVYATLQQVQRRITEAGPTQPGPSAAPGGVRPLQSFAPRPLQTNQGLGTPAHGAPGQSGQGGQGGQGGPNVRPTSFPAGPDATEPLPPATMLVPAANVPRGTLQLPLQIAITLLLLWLVTLIAAWWLGMRQGRNDAPSPDSRVATEKHDGGDKQDPEVATPTGRLGDSIYVLQAVPSFTPEIKATWQKEVDRLNSFMLANANRGWKPYFALREPENGGLQFVFGYANGQFGIDRTKFEDLARLLAAPTSKGGGGHATAKWMSVTN